MCSKILLLHYNLKIATSPLTLVFRREQLLFLTGAAMIFHRNSLQHLPAAPDVISRFAEKAFLQPLKNLLFHSPSTET